VTARDSRWLALVAYPQFEAPDTADQEDGAAQTVLGFIMRCNFMSARRRQILCSFCGVSLIVRNGSGSMCTRSPCCISSTYRQYDFCPLMGGRGVL